MENDVRVPTPFEAFIVIINGFLFSVIPQFLFLGFSEEGLEAADPFTLKWLLLVSEAALLLFPIIYMRFRKLPMADLFRWRPVPAKVLWLSAVLGMSLTVVVDELDRLVQMVFPMPEEQAAELARAMQADSPLEVVILILAAVVLAAVVEESVFRGFLQKSIETHVSVTNAVIYSSLAWAAIHLNLYFMLQIFLFGFVLGFISWRINSIIPAVICHAINNGVAILFYNLNTGESLPLYEWGEHVSPLFLLPAGVLIYRIIRWMEESYRDSTSDRGDSMSV